jgi:hypothetical protein
MRRGLAAVMGARNSPWLWLWWISFPLLVAGAMYAMGGIGAALFGLLLVGISTAVAARWYIRHEMPGTTRTAPLPNTSGAPAVQFRRLWLVLMFALIVGVVIAIASNGIRAATLAIACGGLLILVGGAVALAVMNKSDRGA